MVEVNGLKSIDVEWYTHGSRTIGIVECENTIGERKKYIGVGFGMDEEDDIKLIMKTGAKFRS